MKNSTARNSATETSKQSCKRLSLEKQKPALSAPYGMAGIYFKRRETRTPLKALPSAALRSAPVRTFNGSGKQRLDAALTVGQLSAPPPEAVTLQADQRTDNKVILLPALTCHTAGSGHHPP